MNERTNKQMNERMAKWIMELWTHNVDKDSPIHIPI